MVNQKGNRVFGKDDAKTMNDIFLGHEFDV